MDRRGIEKLLLAVMGVSLLAIGWAVGVATPRGHSSSASTLTITQPGSTGIASTVTVTNTATEVSTMTATETNTQTVQVANTTKPTHHALVLRGVGTETLAPFTLHHSGELVWSCPSCGNANFQLLDPNADINVNGLNVTHGHTYVEAGHYRGILVNTEGESWTLTFQNG